MKDGKLAPVSTILAILQEAFLHADSPVLLDGFPRSVEQMEAFEALVGVQRDPVMLTDVCFLVWSCSVRPSFSL